MDEREKVVKGLECCVDYPAKWADDCGDHGCPYASHEKTCITDLQRDVLKLLKAQILTVEPKRIDLADETKAWLDKMDAVDALGNIANICIDWDGYRTANGLGGLINEVLAYARYCANNLLKAQEPVVPKLGGDAGPFGTHWYQCGVCSGQINPGDKYCRSCGRQVKWDG